MFTDRRDYLMEMIERIVARLVERVRDRVGGTPRELQELERECERAMDDEFAELHTRARGLTSESAGTLIRPVARLRAYATLLAAQALLQERRTQLDPDSAPAADTLAADAQRALELLLEAALASKVTEADRALCPELFRLTNPDSLSPRYLKALVTVGDPPPNDATEP